jgi:hypothetical protein
MMTVLIEALKTAALQRLFTWLAERLFKAAIDNSLKKALPRIFDDIDRTGAYMIGFATKEQMESEITSVIEREIGRVATKADISAVIRLYSPVVACAKRTALLR